MKTALTVCAAVAWLMFATVRSPSLTVSMLDHAQVSGDQIFLSDLLPRGVSAEDLSRCGAIAFGKAPALGSVRVLTRSDINRGLQQRPDCAREMLTPDQVVVRLIGHRISGQAVEKALITFLPQTYVRSAIDSGELSWPTEQEAQDPDPPLQLVTSTWDAAQQRWQFLLRCSSRRVCSSFLVTMHGKPDLFREAEALQTHRRKDQTPIVRRGQKAWLLIDDARIRVSLRVVCLQNGATGERIRVLDPTNHRFLRAEVVAPQLLKAAS
jgi:hypothetical protein